MFHFISDYQFVDTYNVPTDEDILETFGGSHAVSTAGEWAPSWCTSIQKVAIIIPYKNREKHLRILVKHLHPMLQKQLINYQIFVIEQVSMKFNNVLC